MIDYFFGKPRTGKTYRAVNILYEEYIKDENSSPKFANILTNIGGFKFKEINQTFQDRGSSSVAYKLIWKKFYEHLSVMHKMALEDKDDIELNRYAYSHKINDCLIIIDEASLYMKKYDDVISWYLAYHGHFKVRIIIIAQSPKQINAEYLVHAEIYYEAQPQSKQFTNNKLRYLHYSDSYFSKDNKFSSDMLTGKKEIYDLYKSGEIDKPKKILYIFIFYMILALVVMVSLWKFLMYRLTPDTSLSDYNSTSVVSSQDKLIESSLGSINLVNIRCDLQYCWNANSKYQDTQITKSYLKFVILENDLILKYTEVKNEIFKLIPQHRGQKKITLASLTDYYYDIPKEVQKKYLSSLFIKNKVMKNDINNLSTKNSFNPFGIGSEAVTKSEERISDVAKK